MPFIQFYRWDKNESPQVYYVTPMVDDRPSEPKANFVWDEAEKRWKIKTAKEDPWWFFPFAILFWALVIWLLSLGP